MILYYRKPVRIITKSICQFKIDSNERLPFSLHDRVIENIYPENGGIRIILQPCDDGWSSHVVHSVFISDCCWEDISIDYKQRFAPFHISIYIGKAVENTVFKQLLNKGKTMESAENNPMMKS